VLQIYTGLAYAGVALCTLFNVYVVIRGRSGVTGRRIDSRLLLWITSCAVIGIVLLIMALAD
jgi:hypothetical protein